MTLNEKLFSGENKYTVGLIFLFGSLAGYFLNMRKLKINDLDSLLILCVMALSARIVI
jgi:hypothetical protein